MHGPFRQAERPLGIIRVLQVRDTGTGSPVSPKGRPEVMEWNGCLLLDRSLYTQRLRELSRNSTHVLS